MSTARMRPRLLAVWALLLVLVGAILMAERSKIGGGGDPHAEHQAGDRMLLPVPIEQVAVIEIDGDTHAEAETYDAARTRALEARGYRVLRFTNSDVMTNLDEVLKAILNELESPRPLQGERATPRSGAGRGGRQKDGPLSLRR